MSTFIQRQVPSGVFVVFAFLVPYTIGWGWGWWKFAVSSLVIVSLWCWAKPRTFLADLGIRLRGVELGIASLWLLAVGILASYVIPGILSHHGYTPDPHSGAKWKYLAVPFQTLNEEMVLRAFLLTMLGLVVKVRFAGSVVVAVTFTVLHFVLYWLGPPHTALSIQALTTLLLVAFACNEFFLATGSIAIPYGIHFGWNFTRFGNDWIGLESARYLAQGVDFNLIEGNPKVVSLAAALALIATGARLRPKLVRHYE